MAYPPDFDQTWDITAPLDSSAANLIGQDIRNLTNEVMQRMALLSGTFANMPTPETVNATWGGSGFGILYFSLDTKQLFQWNGSAWIDVSTDLPNNGGSSGLFLSDGVVHTVPADTNPHTIYTCTIPANTIGTTGGVKFALAFSGSGSTFSLNVNYGSGEVVATTYEVTGGYLQGFISPAADASHQGGASLSNTGIGPAVDGVTMNVDSTMDQTFDVVAQKSSSGDTLNFLGCYIERI